MREIDTAVAAVEVRTASQKFPAGATVTRADLGALFDAFIECGAIVDPNAKAEPKPSKK